MHMLFAKRRLLPLLVLLLAFPPLTRAAGDPPAPAELLRAGAFETLLDRLEATDFAEQAEEEAPTFLAALRRHLEQGRAHREQRQAARAEALERARERLQEEKPLEALAAALEAHNLNGPDPDTAPEPELEALTDAFIEAAEAAEADGRWIDALAFYRGLENLFPQEQRFRAKLDALSRRVNLLHAYAPEAMFRLRRARAERRGETPPEAAAEPEETWEERLADVELRMLNESLARASRAHVQKRGYRGLLTGALEALILFIETPELADSFPGLREAASRKAMTRFLDRQLRKIRQADPDELNAFDAGRIIRHVLETNAQTLELPRQVLIHEMTDGAMSTLDDFSGVIWPRQLERFRRTTTGAFHGVGIQISRRDGRLVVVSPLPDTPAQRAGIEAGDVITTVDGEPSASWSLDRAVRQITGPVDTEVKLGIERVGEPEPLEFTLTRARIDIESVRGWRRTPDDRWDYWLDRKAGIGYVRISQFLPQTVDDLDRAVETLTAEEGALQGLVLDLRFNPGGLLSSAVEVADRFIERGPIVSTVGLFGEQEERRAKPQHTYPEFPLAILVNQGSASASEIVSGAAQDHGRAIVVGTRTFGKGSVQDLFPVDHRRAYLKLTTQYYQLPEGRIIHRKPGAQAWGVEPDITVPLSGSRLSETLEIRRDADIIREEAEEAAPDPDELIETGLDPQLSTALLLLRGIQVLGPQPLALHQK